MVKRPRSVGCRGMGGGLCVIRCGWVGWGRSGTGGRIQSGVSGTYRERGAGVRLSVGSALLHDGRQGVMSVRGVG
jgi:hypothetical protein